jgi:hypothetical protein
MPHHFAWQSGQAQIAAAGGAGRRSAKNAGAPMNQSREAHPLSAAAPLPLRGPVGGTTIGYFTGEYAAARLIEAVGHRRRGTGAARGRAPS